MTTPTAEFENLASALEGQYRLQREVGRGGMGIVYVAQDERLDRLVAVKTLPPHLGSDATVRDRFLREARTAAALSHPNIVPVHRADEIGGKVFFVMGYVDGESLAHRIQHAGPMRPSEVAPILHDVLDALGYAHSRGVIHRDVKAENILLDSQSGRAMVTDFGIARVAASAPMTATGTVLGTVTYMSPEQVAGEKIDGRSDLYSLGILSFYALSGRFPFESETPSAVLVAHVTRLPPALRDVAPSVPVPLANIVDRLLRKDPADRYETAEEVLEELVSIEHELVRDAAQEVLSSTEAHAVWERAAYLQEMTGHAVTPPELPKRDRMTGKAVTATSGYKMGEVREAAEAVGIKEKYVERALAERRAVEPAESGVHRGVGSNKNAFLGEATTLAYEAVLEGEMRERDFDLMVEIIRRALGDAGNVSAVGRSLSWTSVGSRKAHVSVLVRDGRTSIYVNERLKDLAGGLFGGIVGGAGGGMIGPSIGIGVEALNSGFAAVGIAAGFIGLSYTVARAIFTTMAGRRRKTLQDLTERLAEQARRSIAPAMPSAREVRRLPR